MGIRHILKTFMIVSVMMQLFLSTASSQESGSSVFVSVRQTKLKKEPKFLSSAISDAKYGDSLKVISTKGEWVNVQDKSGKTGFIHSSATNSKKIILNSDSKYTPGSKSSSEGIVLAGKGFNKEVENKYAAMKPNLNYAAVDRMEKIVVSSNDLHQFSIRGKLGE